MTTPTYVAQKTSGGYQLIRRDSQAMQFRSLCALGGMGLAVYGLFSCGLRRLLAGAAGAAILYRGMTGRCPMGSLMSGCARRPARQPEDSPSHQHDHAVSAKQSPDDSVDEASMESFPASDPPSHRPAGA